MFRMKRKAWVVAFALVATLWAACHEAYAGVTYYEKSDTSWEVHRTSDKSLIGPAQNVCLNANAPARCPSGATIYGYAPNRWEAMLDDVPGATWIWAPNVNGLSPAPGEEIYFYKNLPQPRYLGVGTAGHVWLAADNEAELFINGRSIISSTSNNHLVDVDIPSSVFQGGSASFEVIVTAKNAANPPDCTPAILSCNPAGAVFAFRLDVADEYSVSCLPQESEVRPCDLQARGTKSHNCLSNGTWDSWDTSQCVPPDCFDNLGNSFYAGEQEVTHCANLPTLTQKRVCTPTGWGPTIGRCAPRPFFHHPLPPR